MQNTTQSFKNDLIKLHDVLFAAFALWAVWNAVRLHDPSKIEWSIDQGNQVLGRWNGFFTPVGRALHHLVIVEIAKMFDHDSRAVSLTNLLDRARNDASLVPHAQPNDLADISLRLQNVSPTIATIRQLRNQWFAHADAQPATLQSLPSQDVDSLIEDVKVVFNTLSRAHDGNVYSWASALEKCARDTSSILRVLVTEIGRVEAELDDRTVEIVLGEILRSETALGERLDDHEFEHVLGQFSVTPNQEARIREARSQDRD